MSENINNISEEIEQDVSEVIAILHSKFDSQK